MIVFNKIRWKNFLSTGNSFTEMDLDQSQTTLIVGTNGAGKSTMLDALVFALYNKPFRKVNKPQLLNSINKKNLVVEVEFAINSNEYKVIRGLKPTVFEVHMNGRLLNQDSDSRDYQEILEKQVLKLNHKSFCQVVVVGSASFVPFMQLPAQHRREVVEDLLDIQIFSTMNTLLKSRVSENAMQTNKVEYDCELTSEKITMLQTHMDAMVKDNVERIDQLKGELKEIRSLAETEQELQRQVEQLIVLCKTRLADRSEIELEKKETLNQYNKAKSLVDQCNRDITFFEDHSSCPSCKQSIDREHAHVHKAELGELSLKTSFDLGYYDTKLKLYDATLVKMDEDQKLLNKLQIQLAQHANSIAGFITRGQKVVQEINRLKEKVQAFTQNDDMGVLEQQFQTFMDQKNNLAKDKEALFVASLVLKDTGIKARIIKQYVPIINKLINKYLAALDFFVSFELDENFNETIKSRHRDEFTYASFSEGEKMRINLAILFTWRAVAKLRNSVSTNLLIMDEVLDGSLDTNGTDEFLKILNNLTQDTNTFIISHKSEQMFDKFSSVVRFEKIKNFSRIAV